MDLLKASGQTFIFSSDGFTGYLSNVNTFNLGAFSIPDGWQAGYLTNSLAHELFHAHQDASGSNLLGSIACEAEAKLFESLIAKELDFETTFNDFFNETEAGINFKDAWDDITKNDNFTLENFNTLVDNFKEGTNGGSVYDHLDADHIDSLDQVFIDEIYDEK